MDFWEMYYAAVVAAFGLAFGSFLNCAAMRMARHEDFVHGHSRCMDCGHTLSAVDLVPVASWVMSGGKCRYCGQKVSARYPLTELLFAVLCVGVYLRHGLSAETARDLVLVGCLFALSIVDLECFEIPDGCLLVGLAAWAAALPFMGWSWTDALVHIAAGLLCGGAMLGVSLALDYILKKESLGGGDIKLFALLGLYLGLLESYFLVLLSCVIGLVFVGTARLVGRDAGCGRHPLADGERENGKHPSASGEAVPEGAFPFGPSIAAAGYILLLSGDAAAEWYLGFF